MLHPQAEVIAVGNVAKQSVATLLQQTTTDLKEKRTGAEYIALNKTIADLHTQSNLLRVGVASADDNDEDGDGDGMDLEDEEPGLLGLEDDDEEYNPADETPAGETPAVVVAGAGGDGGDAGAGSSNPHKTNKTKNPKKPRKGNTGNTGNTGKTTASQVADEMAQMEM